MKVNTYFEREKYNKLEIKRKLTNTTNIIKSRKIAYYVY